MIYVHNMFHICPNNINVKLLIAKNLPWVYGTCPFYRVLVVGLLFRIHHYHGLCGRLMEKMGFVERNLGSSLHILGEMCRGLIMWNTQENLSQNLLSMEWSSIHLLVHRGLSSDWTIRVLFMFSHSLTFLSVELFGRGQAMDDYHGQVDLKI